MFKGMVVGVKDIGFRGKAVVQAQRLNLSDFAV